MTDKTGLILKINGEISDLWKKKKRVSDTITYYQRRISSKKYVRNSDLSPLRKKEALLYSQIYAKMSEYYKLLSE